MNPVVVPVLIAAQAVIKLRGDKPKLTAAIQHSRGILTTLRYGVVTHV